MVNGSRLQSVIAAKAREAGLTQEQFVGRATAGMSMKSLIAPEKIASTALFLASEFASAINGQAIPVDNDTHYMV
jgi:enoyl-[acyl-carrier-protein] reductase (NADH)